MSFKEGRKEVNIKRGDVLKVKSKDGSEYGELKVLFCEKSIIIGGSSIEVRNWVCERISGNISDKGYYEKIRKEEDVIVVNRLRIRDLTGFVGEYVFYIRGFIK